MDIGNKLKNKSGKQAKILISEMLYDLINDLKQHPEVGVPLYGPLINTVTRGARLKKLYLRSAATGIGNNNCRLYKKLYRL